MGVDPNDFAYCILAQEPDVEPIPIIMHCEVDEFLDGSYTLDVAAVGFGYAANMGMGNESGRKRWSSASTKTTTSITSAHSLFFLGQFTTFDPGYPVDGDSGGPLFLKLPDGSWRVLGINVTAGGTAGGVIPPWKFVEWMLTDDEVLDQIDALIPCHDDDGTWAPGPGCESFPSRRIAAVVDGPAGRQRAMTPMSVATAPHAGAPTCPSSHLIRRQR
jgi:hypothetical protein